MTYASASRGQHGVISLLLAGAAVLTAAVSLTGHASWQVLAVFAALVGVAGLVTLATFCAKCAARERGCAHVLPAALARLLPARAVGRYPRWEIGLTAAALISVLAFPQPWLAGQPPALVLFWVLLGAAAVEARCRVCPSCRNEHCPVHRPTQRGVENAFTPPHETERR